MIEYVKENLQFSDELVVWSKKYIHEMKENELSDKLMISQRKEARKIEFQDKKASLRAMYRDHKFTEDEYKEDMSILANQYSDTEQDDQSTDWYSRLMEITNITESIESVFKSDNIEAKRRMLASLGSNLVWNDKELFIHNDIAIETLVLGIKSIKSKYPGFEPNKYVVNKGSKEKIEPKNSINSMMLLR